MKKLAAYDFDGTLAKTPHPEEGKKIWKEKTGEEYPNQGWWSYKESMDSDVFDIGLYPNILSLLKKDLADPDTHVIILTSRRENLRPELERILDDNNVSVDDIIMKDGGEDKGDILLQTSKYNPDLEQIDMYDDFAQGEEHKIEELTKIKDTLPDDIEYNLYFVENDQIRLMESTNILKKMIYEEILNLK